MDSMDLPSAPRSRVATGIGLLMSVAAATLAVASLLHFGVTIPLGAASIRDPFGAAAIPEAVIAVVVAAGAVSMLARLGAAWWLALTATLLALAGTIYGLTVTVRRGQAGDIAYHAVLLTMLVASAALLLTPAGTRARPGA